MRFRSCQNAGRERGMTVYRDPRSQYWHYDFQIHRRRFYGSTKRRTKSEAEAAETACSRSVRDSAPTDPDAAIASGAHEKAATTAEHALVARMSAPAWPLGDLKPRAYRVILADPPYKFSSGPSRNPRNHMTLAEIASLPIGELAIARLLDGPRCELFARSRHPGFESWGNEIDRLVCRRPARAPR
jgi:hypothetical protein